MPPYGDYSDPEDIRGRRGLTRDITERQARVREDPGFLYDIAKIGALGLAAGLLGRTMRRDSVMEALHLLGQKAKAVTAPVGEFARGFMDELAGVVRVGDRRIKSFDLLEQITESMAVYRQGEAAGKTPAELQSVIAAARDGLRDRGFEDLDRAGLSRLRAATVGDIFQSNQLQDAIGGTASSSFRVISEAHQLGMVSSEMALTRGYGGLFMRRAGAGTPAQVLDTRYVSPRNILSSAYNLARSIRVPFTGFRPADLVAAVVRPFGEGHFAGQVGRDLELAKGVTTSRGLNFVVGGRLLSEDANGVLQVTASGLRLGRVGRVGQAHLERMGASQRFLGRGLDDRIQHGGRGGFKGFVDWIQHKTGVGPAYRTRDPAIKTLGIDPVLRRERGEAIPKPYVQRRFNESWLDQYRTHAEAEQLGIDPERLLSQAQPNARHELSFFDKVKAHIGIEDRGIVMRRGATAPYTPHDIAVQDVEFTGKLAGRRAALPGEPVAPTYLGQLQDPPTVPNEFYAYLGKGRGLSQDPVAWIRGQAEAAVDLLHYGTNRLNDLMGATVGLGFRPSVGKGIGGGLAGFGKNVLKLYTAKAMVEGAFEYAGYADYLAETVMKPIVTVGGLIEHPYTSPKKAAIGLYQGAQLARTGVRDVLGVDNAARYAEDLMPGSMNTGLSFLVRTVLPAAIGVAKSGLPGLKAGAALSALIGGTEPGKTFSEQLAEFTGDKEVAVRKSRWWMLGRQPFEGGQIDHYEPHWTRRELSDYRFTDVQYGSKGEYYSNVARIPTPHNFMGLGLLFQEGGPVGGGDLYLAKKHQMDRPYPNTPGIDQDEAYVMSQYLASRGPYDAPAGAGQRLGYGTAGKMSAPPERSSGMLGSIKAAGEELAELSGVYKFMFWDLPGFSEGKVPKMASYETIGSRSREFWDANLGGGLGMTELYRRFMDPDEAKQGINPVPNLMPTWLPGVRSEHESDRQYNTDFTLGDPYAKVQHGEFRLPGAGYEALHRLHSGTPGVYDPMDRFLILADVAPNSQAFKQYRTIVEGWADAGVLDRHWASKFKVAKKQVSERMERYQFYDRRFSGLITDPNPDLTADKYNLIERAVGGAWELLSHDVASKFGNVVPIVGPIVSDKLFPVYSPVEHYQRFQTYGEEFADWRSPWKALLRPRIHSLTAEDPLTAAAGGAAFGLFGANPMAALALSVAGGAGIGGASTARAISTGQWEGGYVPQHRQEQYQLDEYFDNLQYAKGRILEERSRAVGDEELASHYADMRNRTIAAVNYTGGAKQFMSQAIRGMPREQRGYFKHFMAMPEGTQDYVMNYLPENVQPLLVQASGRMNEQKFSRYQNWSRAQSDQRVASYFAQIGGMPDSGWGGWHPDVPMDAIKMKMVDAGWNSTSADIHKFSLFDEHIYRAGKFDSLTVPDTRNLDHIDRSDPSHADLLMELQAAGFQNARIRNTIGGAHDTVRWNVRRSNWDQVRDTLGNMFR